MRVLSRPLLLALTTLVLGACSGTDPETVGEIGTPDGGPTSAEPVAAGSGSAEELEQAATAHFEAFVAKDGETWFAMLSRACRERLGFAAADSHIDGRHFRAGLNGIDVTALSVADVAVSGGGSEADVTLSIDGTTETFREALPQRWIFEDGGWHLDDCADVGESQGGLEGFGMDRNNPAALGGVVDVNGWLLALTHVEPDGEDLVVELGGEPATEGNQHFYVQINLSYNGAEPSLIVGDELTFAMVSGETVYGDDASCGSDDPSFYDPSAEFQPGPSGGLYLVCREVAAGDVADLLLQITHVPTGGNWWFRLDGT